MPKGKKKGSTKRNKNTSQFNWNYRKGKQQTTRRFNNKLKIEKCSTKQIPRGNQILDNCVSADKKTIYLNNVEYNFEKEIARGGYGVVDKYSSSNTDTCIKSIAVKTFQIRIGSQEKGESDKDYKKRESIAKEDAKKEFENEKRACIELFKLYDVVIESYYNDNHYMIIMVKYDHTLDALTYRKDCPIGVKCDFMRRFDYFCQVIDCLIKLLKNNFIYTDLKSNNVMYEVDTDSVILVDIGGIFKNDGTREINAIFTFPHRGDGSKMIDAFCDIPLGTSCWDVRHFYKHYLQQVVSLYHVFVNNYGNVNYIYMDKQEIRKRKLNDTDFYLLHDEYFDKFKSPITNDVIIKELEGYKVLGNINNFPQYSHNGLINIPSKHTPENVCISDISWWDSLKSYYNMLEDWKG